MNFGPVPIEEAEGKILGHNIARPDGRRALRKGKPVTAKDVETLRQLGRSVVYVAEIEADDVDEDSAALRVGQAVMGRGLRLSGPANGRVNFRADGTGILRVDATRLAQLNSCHGITLATLRTNAAVEPGRTVATAKVVPYAIPEAVVREAERIAAEGESMILVEKIEPRRVALILSGSPPTRERILAGYEPILRARVESFGATLDSVDFVPLEDEPDEIELAQMLQQRLAAGVELILLAGETAIMDRHDIAPRAVERAGGEVTCVGAPVDPGNLAMVAYLDDVPILGAPGCARSRKANIVDWLLPRMLAGERLSRADIVAMGHGGLLEDVPERPVPRSHL